MMIKATLLSDSAWVNVPSKTSITESDLNKMSTVTTCRSIDELNNLSMRVYLEPPKHVSYVCKNCNGHINPATMKCEYCDTQY